MIAGEVNRNSHRDRLRHLFQNNNSKILHELPRTIKQQISLLKSFIKNEITFASTSPPSSNVPKNLLRIVSSVASPLTYNG